MDTDDFGILPALFMPAAGLTERPYEVKKLFFEIDEIIKKVFDK